MKKIKIVFEGGRIEAELNNTDTARLIVEALPIEGKVNTWGEETYFTIPVDSGEEPTTEEVEVGTIAYWPPGRAFCIFFGRTPASIGEEPRAASPVVVLGKVLGDLEVLKKVKSGESVKISL